jgi:hypothetical protein
LGRPQVGPNPIIGPNTAGIGEQPYIIVGGVGAARYGYDSMEGYAANASVDKLDMSVVWTNGLPARFNSAYADRVAYIGLRATDDIESYSNGVNLNALNGGTGFSNAFVDR